MFPVWFREYGFAGGAQLEPLQLLAGGSIEDHQLSVARIPGQQVLSTEGEFYTRQRSRVGREAGRYLFLCQVHNHNPVAAMATHPRFASIGADIDSTLAAPTRRAPPSDVAP